MQGYILMRLVEALVSVLGMTVIIFVLVRLTGSPLDVYVPLDAGPQAYEEMAQQLGLDKPPVVQYGIFLMDMLGGNFGRSFRWQRPAMEVVMERFPATLWLTFASMFISTLIAVPIGVLSAVKKDSFLDSIGKGFAILGQSLPIFWLGIILMWVFAVGLRWLPAGGAEGPEYIILPAVSMGWYFAAGIMRLTRSGMMDVLGSEYVKMLRIKGLPEYLVIWKHCLRNGIIPAVTFTSIIFITLMAGAIVTETVFAWPGVGRLALESVVYRDFPVLQAVVILLTIMYLAGNFLVDLLYAWLDPRVRYAR